VDYSLFIMVMTVEMLEKVEIPPTVAPTEFPPPIFNGFGPVSMFLCFRHALFEETLGSYI
jgi:hypothetical protein